jgi:hypothetical protein
VDVQQTRDLDFSGQFGAIDVIASALIEKTREEAV